MAAPWLQPEQYENVLAALALVVILAMLLERALALVFAKPEDYSGALSFGTFATAAVIAGGSKGAILLFQGVLGFGREAVKARSEARSSASKGE